MNFGKVMLVFGVLFFMAGFAAAGVSWTSAFSEDFSDVTGWSYTGQQNGGGQDMIRHDSTSGNISAEWDQSNYFAYTDPVTINNSCYSTPLGLTLTDDDTFRFGFKLNVTSVANTSELYQAANAGLYNLAEMGPDRAMSDNWFDMTSYVKDSGDFVEWNYFIGTEWGGRNTQSTIGAHIEGLDGYYIAGDKSDVEYFHSTRMGDGDVNQLPTGTDLYVEVIYYGDTTDSGLARRSFSAVYTDPAHTQVLTVNGVEQYYWTMALPEGESFTLTDFAFFNYATSSWGGVNGTGSGSFDDVFVETGAWLDGDADGDGVVSAGDYASVRANFGNVGAPGIPGDANGDGVVSADDYVCIQANFGNALPGAEGNVPEPTTICILIGGMSGLIIRGKKN